MARHRNDVKAVPESSREPAKLAERVIAPSDGVAKPGVTDGNSEPAQQAKDG